MYEFLPFLSYDDMIVICYHWAFKFAYFVEHNINYQPSTFNSLGCLDQILQRGGGGEHPPVLLGLKFYQPLKHAVALSLIEFHWS